jgi:hypothetical protein
MACVTSTQTKSQLSVVPLSARKVNTRLRYAVEEPALVFKNVRQTRLEQFYLLMKAAIKMRPR